MRLGEKSEDIGGHVLADAVYVEKPGPGLAFRVLRRFHLATPPGERAVMAGGQPPRRLPHFRNAERIDEALERDPPTLVDRGHQIAGAEFAPALSLGDDLRIEAEDIARLADQPVPPKTGDVLFAEPFDVEAIARHERREPLDGLRGTDRPAGAAPRALPRLAHRKAAADRAVVGKLVGHCVLWPTVEHDRDDLRDHVTGPLYDNGVADAHVLALDLVLVVQSGALHDDAPDCDRFEHRHRGQ